MLVGGVIEKWNLIVDFEDKKIPFANYELLTQSMTKISAAYPYRLKRLLMVNSSTKQDTIKTSLINFLEQTESEAKIMVIGSWS